MLKQLGEVDFVWLKVEQTVTLSFSVCTTTHTFENCGDFRLSAFLPVEKKTKREVWKCRDEEIKKETYIHANFEQADWFLFLSQTLGGGKHERTATDLLFSLRCDFIQPYLWRKSSTSKRQTYLCVTRAELSMCVCLYVCACMYVCVYGANVCMCVNSAIALHTRPSTSRNCLRVNQVGREKGIWIDHEAKPCGKSHEGNNFVKAECSKNSTLLHECLQVTDHP